VPGDPIAGFLLASLGAGAVNWVAVIPAALAGLLLYAAGLVQNDLADLQEDRRERPGRPLASGAIRSSSAVLAVWVLAGLGLAASLATQQRGAFYIACVLVLCITIYNRLSKHLPVVGPLNMGLCRGLSLLLGAAAAGPGRSGAWCVMIGAGTLVLYVAAVTAVAAGETRARRLTLKRYLPAAALAAGFTALYAELLWPLTAGVRWSMVLAAAGTAWALWWGRRLKGAPRPEAVQRAVGGLLGGLLLIQASLVAVAAPAGGLWVAAALLGAWFAATLLARRFAPS